MYIYIYKGLILESNGMHAFFSEKGAKIFEIWVKMYKVLTYFEIGQPHACDYCAHKTAQVCPIIYVVFNNIKTN